MSNRILVDGTKPVPKLFLEGIEDLKSGIDKLNRVLKACDMMTWGSPADMASLATEMGITATTAGNAPADFYTLLQSALANTALNADVIAELIRRTDQGGG